MKGGSDPVPSGQRAVVSIARGSPMSTCEWILLSCASFKHKDILSHFPSPKSLSDWGHILFD